jgi:hypothetical protein
LTAPEPWPSRASTISGKTTIATPDDAGPAKANSAFITFFSGIIEHAVHRGDAGWFRPVGNSANAACFARKGIFRIRKNM